MSSSVIPSIAAIDASLLLTQKVQQRCRARFPVYAMAWTHPKTEGVRGAWGWRSIKPSETGVWVVKPYTRSGDLDPETGSPGAEKGRFGVFLLV